MTVTNTSLLGLALPTTGTESGVWGDDVNNGLTILIDVSVAGTNNITQDSDITLAVSNGNNSSSFTSTATNSTVAQYSTLNCTGSRGAIRNIIAPASSRTFVVINNTTGGFAIVIKKSGGTGVSIAPNETAIVYYDSITATDYVKVSSNTITSLVGILGTANGGTGLGGSIPYTANGVVYASSTSALATGSVLTFDGANIVVNATTPAYFTGTSNLAQISINRSPSTGAIFNASQSAAYLNIDGASGGSSFQFVTASAANTQPSEKMRLDGSGNLGIGTNSPSSQLTVSGSGATLGQFISSGSATYIEMDNSGGSGYIGTTGNNILFLTSTGGTERMRIDSSGNLLVGTTSQLNGYNARITPLASSTTTQAINAVGPNSYTNVLVNTQSVTTASTAFSYFIGQSGNGTSVTTNNVFIYGNGNITNTNNSYGAISDVKLKENIVDATPKLDKLMQVRIRNYNLKGEYQQHKQLGVIAQELETIFPAMIEESPDRDTEGNVLETTTKSVKYSVFVPMLIKAIQEQQAIIESLTTRLTALENK